jgi:hypothetical protein
MGYIKKNCASQVHSQCEEKDEIWRFIQPERGSLKKLKRLSIRSKAWFRVLDWKQRRLIDVVVRTVDRICSPLLLGILAPLVKRLLEAIGGEAKTGALALMGKNACEIVKGEAEKIITIAQKWGNKSANKWLTEGFIKYLIVMNFPKNQNLFQVDY